MFLNFFAPPLPLPLPIPSPSLSNKAVWAFTVNCLGTTTWTLPSFHIRQRPLNPVFSQHQIRAVKIFAFIISIIIDMTILFLLNLSGFSNLPLHLLVYNLGISENRSHPNAGWYIYMIIMKAKILRQRLGWKNPGFQTRCGDYRLHAG